MHSPHLIPHENKGVCYANAMPMIQAVGAKSQRIDS